MKSTLLRNMQLCYRVANTSSRVYYLFVRHVGASLEQAWAIKNFNSVVIHDLVEVFATGNPLQSSLMVVDKAYGWLSEASAFEVLPSWVGSWDFQQTLD